MEGSEIWISFRRIWISFRRTLILFRLVLISFRWILNSFHASWRLERGGAWTRFGVAALERMSAWDCRHIGLGSAPHWFGSIQRRLGVGAERA